MSCGGTALRTRRRIIATDPRGYGTSACGGALNRGQQSIPGLGNGFDVTGTAALFTERLAQLRDRLGQYVIGGEGVLLAHTYSKVLPAAADATARSTIFCPIRQIRGVSGA